MKAVDSLLQEATQWTPREAVAFLLAFERSFASETGREPSRVERLILTSLLRRRALNDR
jgi:hypothetical protein